MVPAFLIIFLEAQALAYMHMARGDTSLLQIHRYQGLEAVILGRFVRLLQGFWVL